MERWGLRRCSKCRGAARGHSNEVGVERGLLCLARAWSDGERSEEAQRLIVLYKSEGMSWSGCSFVELGGVRRCLLARMVVHRGLGGGAVY